MTGTPLVVLDACVLANFSFCDTLLNETSVQKCRTWYILVSPLTSFD